MILRPASNNAQFLRPMIVNRFPTSVLDKAVELTTRNQTFQSSKLKTWKVVQNCGRLVDIYLCKSWFFHIDQFFFQLLNDVIFCTSTTVLSSSWDFVRVFALLLFLHTSRWCRVVTFFCDAGALRQMACHLLTSQCWLQAEFTSVPSPRGCFWGLTPQTKLQAPPNWNMKHYKSFVFCHFLKRGDPPYKPKDPPQKRKAPLLKTFWRRFWSTLLTFPCLDRKFWRATQATQKVWCIRSGHSSSLVLHTAAKHL